jgi:16S rRNA G527 N7-methylase RsmG
MRHLHGLTELLARFDLRTDSEIGNSFRRYLELLEKWNARVNLTASTTWDSLEPLFHEALWAASLYPHSGTAHLDIGSGGGFPALPLRILRPAMSLTMVEPRARKAAFLETAAYELGLKGTIVHADTISDYLKHVPRPFAFDFISWKAVKLARSDVGALAAAAGRHTRFWIFHAAEVPVDDGGLLDVARRDKFPGGRDWFLSAYRVKHV